MFNQIILAGRCVKNPEVVFTPKGNTLAKLRVAVNTTVKNNTETLFINTVVFGKTAEAAQKYLKKGSPVLIEGRLKSRNFTDSSGQNRTVFEIVARRIKFLPGGNKTDFDNAFETELDPF